MSAMLGGVTKLFGISRKKLAGPKENIESERHARHLLHPLGLSVPELTPNRVRVVVFRDEKGIKQPIFDSQQLTNEEGEEQCTRSLCDMRCGERLEFSLSTSSNGVVPSSTRSAGWGTQSGKTRRGILVKRPSTDSELLGEMMFGSMPMKVIGDTVKVHYIRSTDQLMLSKVFTSQRRPLPQCSLMDFTDSCPLPSDSPVRSVERSFSTGSKSQRHVSPEISRPHSSTLSVPISSSQHLSSLSTSPYTTSSNHTHSPPSPLSSLNSPSFSSSLSRRIQRSRSTSLENASELYRKVLKPLDKPSNLTRKKRKYAIGVIISLSELSKPEIRHFQSFMFSHFTLFDAHLERLKIGVEEACTNRNQGMLDSITRAYDVFLEDFISLYRTPRIESPVWLSLVSRADKRKEVCLQFMEEFASAIVEMDTKETKFFLSSLLTAVLSHHLAWIFTVSQQHSTDPNSRHYKHASKSLGVLAESHPYNPLWAQLGDLFGLVSNPLKISRTIVTGQSSSIVSRLLYILTYFIRCSEVEPGLHPDPTPVFSTSAPIATTAQKPVTRDMRIPSGSSVSESSFAGEKLHEVGSHLEDNDIFGSRASSVTVMSEPDHHFSPFASPVNHGADTPIVRTHPFSIRSSFLSPCENRKSSQSESDSIDGSQHLRGHEVASNTSCRTNKKFIVQSKPSDTFSTSQASYSSLKKNSPLLSSARQTVNSSTSILYDGRKKESDVFTSPLPDVASHQCNCHYGNPNMCSNMAQCESMGLCPNQDGFLVFDPAKKLKKSRSCHGHAHSPLYSCETDEDYSLSHLATCGMLGPPSSLDSAPSAPPSRMSCSSLDSGYEQSWSLTNSSRDSYAEITNSFVMVSSNKNNTPPGQLYGDSGIKCCCGECDLGRSSQCSCQRKCKRTLLPDLVGQEMAGKRQSDQFTSRRAQIGANLSQNDQTGYNLSNASSASTGIPTKGEAPSNMRDDQDVMNSLFPLKLSNHVPRKTSGADDLPSPLSPGGSDSDPPVEDFPVTADPLQTLKPVKLKNHMKALSQKLTTSSENVNVPSSDFVGVEKNSEEQREEESDLENSDSTPKFFVGSASAAQSSSTTPSSTLRSISSLLPSSMNPRNPSHSLPLIPSVDPACTADRGTCNDLQSVCSEADSGRGTDNGLSIGSQSTYCESENGRGTNENNGCGPDGGSCQQESDRPGSSSNTLNVLPSLQYQQDQRATSSPPVFGCQIRQENEEVCSLGGATRSFPRLSKRQCSSSNQELSCSNTGEADKLEFRSLETFRSNHPPSVLHQQLHEHDQSLLSGDRPRALNQFDNFTDVPLPNLEEFDLDMPSIQDRWGKAESAHRQEISDFGHSLFVGVSPHYLPDFVLHGTTESAGQSFQDKLYKDLAHAVKYSIIDEPVDHGVGIVADTDTWTVKVVAVSKSLQTSDVICGSGLVQPAKCVKQMLSSVKNMHSIRMPPEFCLSHVEDCLMSLNEKSVMLAEALLEKGNDADMDEILPKIVDGLSVASTDISMLFALAAVNCHDPDLSARFNHKHMRWSIGKHFI